MPLWRLVLLTKTNGRDLDSVVELDLGDVSHGWDLCRGDRHWVLRLLRAWLSRFCTRRRVRADRLPRGPYTIDHSGVVRHVLVKCCHCGRRRRVEAST